MLLSLRMWLCAFFMPTPGSALTKSHPAMMHICEHRFDQACCRRGGWLSTVQQWLSRWTRSRIGSKAAGMLSPYMPSSLQLSTQYQRAMSQA